MTTGRATISSTGSRGLTLVELLVVMGIIGLMVGLSVPALSRYAAHVRLKAAVRQVTGLVSFARSMAISAHEDQAVVVDPERGQISVVTVSSGEAFEQKVRLPSSVSIEVLVGEEPATETRLVFRPTGSLIGRTTSLVLADRRSQHTITVTGTTGAVSIQ